MSVQYRLMTHLVCGYPSMDASFRAATAMAGAGAAYLEVQFPFSDPSADGPAIQKACSEALEAGFTVEEGFRQVERICAGTDVPVFIMSYANIPFHYGIASFAARAKACGAAGLIIPDLVPGDDEGLYRIGREAGLAVMPVIVPTVPESRLEEILALEPEYLYVAMRVGITGKKTEITDELVAFLESLKGRTKVLAGFGIQEASQVEALASHAHALIVGSSLVRCISAVPGGGAEDVASAVTKLVRELSAGRP